MYKKILVAVDLSELDIAQPALAAAIELATLTSGELRLVHVRHRLPSAPISVMAADLLSDQEQYFKGEMDRLMAKVPYPKERLSSANLIGTVYAEILQEAKSWGADLIVLSAHRPSMATYLLGSNAAKVVRHAECTTLVVRSHKPLSLMA
ncbi:MAG TPA: universal stress protein [Beijerinckiaceae bacterium]|nr:universal stress protein [Beijerinckiaceae bacterium]